MSMSTRLSRTQLFPSQLLTGQGTNAADNLEALCLAFSKMSDLFFKDSQRTSRKAKKIKSERELERRSFKFGITRQM